MVNLRVPGPDPIAERFGALAELRDAGLIRQLGISNVRPGRLAEAQAIAPVVCVQNRYGIGARPGGDEVLAVARAHGATPAQVRLAWTLQRGPHVLAIPGTSDPDHLAANVAAGAG